MTERGSECVCKLTTPCHENCTCLIPVSSRGCRRCVSYGSESQRTEHAEILAKAIDDYPKLLKEIEQLNADLQRSRRSHAILSRAIKKSLGLINWPEIKGEFVDGVVKLLQDRDETARRELDNVKSLFADPRAILGEFKHLA